MMRLYDRQKELNLKVPEAVAVLGVGGIGSWVALDLALVGVKKLILIDSDIVEEHNLNRTPFSKDHVGKFKVHSLAMLIKERRPDITVLPLTDRRFDDNINLMKSNRIEYVIDCRDRLIPNRLMGVFPYVKLGYDGKKMTIHFNPRPETVWGEGHRYTVVPSYLVPPQFLAGLITEVITSGKFPEDEKVINLDMEKVVEVLLDV